MVGCPFVIPQRRRNSYVKNVAHVRPFGKSNERQASESITCNESTSPAHAWSAKDVSTLLLLVSETMQHLAEKLKMLEAMARYSDGPAGTEQHLTHTLVLQPVAAQHLRKKRCSEQGLSREVLRVPQVASLLGLSERKVWELIASKALRSFKIDGARFVCLRDLQDFIKEQRGDD